MVESKVEVLLRVSEVNLARAKKRFSAGEYDSAVFHASMAVESAANAMILKLGGDEAKDQRDALVGGGRHLPQPPLERRILQTPLADALLSSDRPSGRCGPRAADGQSSSAIRAGVLGRACDTEHCAQRSRLR